MQKIYLFFLMTSFSLSLTACGGDPEIQITSSLLTVTLKKTILSQPTIKEYPINGHYAEVGLWGFHDYSQANNIDYIILHRNATVYIDTRKKPITIYAGTDCRIFDHGTQAKVIDIGWYGSNYRPNAFILKHPILSTFLDVGLGILCVGSICAWLLIAAKAEQNAKAMVVKPSATI